MDQVLGQGAHQFHPLVVATFGALIGIFAVLAVRWHLSKRPEFEKFTLLDAIAEAGAFSLERTGRSIALAVTTAGFVYQVSTDHLTEWYMGVYAAAWISADIFRRRQTPE
jgi:hypothetical protein